MIILPAIDIINKTPVRLYQGNFSTAEKVAENALETAKLFEKDGAKWIHMVDLDGSREKKRVNSEIFVDVVKNTSLKVEVGGGIRTIEDIDFYISNGVSHVILGSAAITNYELVKSAVKKYNEKIVVGIDAKNGYAVTEGWTEKSEIDYIDLAKKMEDIGVGNIIYTDISKDGTLNGPNFNELEKLNESVSCDITASGGIKDLDDIIKLNQLGFYGAICGKSIYNNKLSLKEAIKICR